MIDNLKTAISVIIDTWIYSKKKFVIVHVHSLFRNVSIFNNLEAKTNHNRVQLKRLLVKAKTFGSMKIMPEINIWKQVLSTGVIS